MIFPPVYFHWWCSHLFDWKNHGRKTAPERSEHATGVEPAGDHQWLAVFLTLFIV